MSSLFDKIFRPKKGKSEAASDTSQGYFYTLRNYQPVFATHNGEIYEIELIRAAIDARARHISKLKAEIVGSSKPQLQSKLRQGPNQWQTWSQFLYRTSTILDVQNTAFVVPVFDEGLNITGYYPVLPERAEIVSYKNEPWLRYRFTHGETAAVELKQCAILNKYQYKDDFFGDPNNALDETMKLMEIQNQGIEDAVKNAASYRFIAQVNNFSKAEDLSKERQRFSQENLTKDSQGGGLLLFPNTYQNIQQVKANAPTVDPDQREQINDNVFRYFGVNDKILKNEATGDDLDAFFNGAVEPFAIQFSEAMTKAIFSERERAQGSFFIANANRLQYMTTTSKVSLAQQMLDRGVMSINEARELFNYAPVKDGDVRTIRGEYKSAREDLGGISDANETK
ncbi:MAG: phage portal protein [Lachnospiraceae bacterium]|nr:phage portal protein [Lachnospiraceae bacterium]